MLKFLRFSINPKSGVKLDMRSSHFGMRILLSVEEHESGFSLTNMKTQVRTICSTWKNVLQFRLSEQSKCQKQVIPLVYLI